MSHACTPILVGVPSLVSEILLLSKTANIPFPTMDYSPLSSKSLINWNRLKKFMHLGIDVTCMNTNFGGHALFGFGDIATLKNGQFSLSDHGQSMVIKKFNRSESAQKFMHVGIDVKFMHTNFGRHALFGFRDIATFKNGQFSLSIVHGHQKI